MLINTLDPVLFDLGFTEIRWYGLFMALGFALCFIIEYRLFVRLNYPLEHLYNLALYLFIGFIAGARLGHVVFYELDFYLGKPINILFINQGGLSSHGATIGLILAYIIFAWINSKDIKPALSSVKSQEKASRKEDNKRYLRIKTFTSLFGKYIDVLVLPIPLMAGAVRLGNFFNSEIVGRPTDLPWGVKFPLFEVDAVTRHPSQLYEAIIAFIIFIIIIAVFRKYYLSKEAIEQGKSLLPRYFVFFLFIILYFGTRFLIEFVKEYQTLAPSFPLTMGQILSIPFIVGAIIYFIWFFTSKSEK